MRFSGTPVRRDKAGPRLGEDTTPILEELGYAPADIQDLRTRGVVKASVEAGSR
jgi:crotonobetainyl-CoA:carnitine CoA-transferase CaiB-like acyl-CoA transferase